MLEGGTGEVNITQMLEQKADELKMRVQVLDKALELMITGELHLPMEAMQTIKTHYITKAERALTGETLQVTR